MKYVSTRGQAPASGFSDVLLAGLARDGGLYVPEIWPTLERRTRSPRSPGSPMPRPRSEVIRPFVGGEIADAALRAMCDAAYAAFRHPAVAPLIQLGPGEWVLELFHGPTLAFKDVAMQLLARLMDHVLAERGERVTIVGATSGDTGAAAIEAFRGRDNVDVFILFPEGRVSPIQQRQMTTVAARQRPRHRRQGHLRRLPGDGEGRCSATPGCATGWRSPASTRSTGRASSARSSTTSPPPWRSARPPRPVSFTVPTGNFGDIFAGYAAKRMGLPIERLVIATNVNDILARDAATAAATRCARCTATTSPSMDIQVSSNFERLLFEAYGRDAAAVERLMAAARPERAPSTSTRGAARRASAPISPPAAPTRPRPPRPCATIHAARPASCPTRTPRSASRSAAASPIRRCRW